jgi:hypothetical protein
MPGPEKNGDPAGAGESVYARRAAEAVGRLEKAVRRYRRVVQALVLAFVLLAVGGWFLWGAIRDGQQTSVRNCQAGNTYRAEQTQIWNRFVQLLTAPEQPTARQARMADDVVQVLSGDPAVRKEGAAALLNLLHEGATDPDTIAKARGFIAFVQQVDAPRDCARTAG